MTRLPGIVIGVVTSGMSLTAIRICRYLGAIPGKRIEVVGGVVLIGIGFRILLTQRLA